MSINNLKASFFDDNETNSCFEFVRPLPKHEKMLNQPDTLKSPITCLDYSTKISVQSIYALHGTLLARYENSQSTSPLTVIDLAYARMKPLAPKKDEKTYGFSVVKNGACFELYFADLWTFDDWFDALKTVCVKTSFHEEYKALKILGEGSFARVYLVESRTDSKRFAVKAFHKASQETLYKKDPKAPIINEINMLRALDHENIIKLYEVFESEKTIYLVMEYVESKTLGDVMKRSDWKDTYSHIQIVSLAHSIIHTLAYLSSQGIMHRDLKPDNILIAKGGKLKIIDFGLAVFVDSTEHIFNRCGTPGYIAPEVFYYDPSLPSTAYNATCDSFSAGSIIFYMLFGFPLFGNANTGDVIALNKTYNDMFLVNAMKDAMKMPDTNVDKDGVSILLSLLDPDRRRRMTSEQALEHAFFGTVQNKMIKFSSSKNIIVGSVTSKTDFNSLSPISKNIENPCLLTLKCDLSPLQPSKRKASQNDSIIIGGGASRNGSRNYLKPSHKGSFNSPALDSNKLSTAVSNNEIASAVKPNTPQEQPLERIVGSIPEINFNSMNTVKTQNCGGRRKYTEPCYFTTKANEQTTTKFMDYLSPLKTRGDTNIISSQGSVGENGDAIPSEDIQVMNTSFPKPNPGQLMIGRPRGGSIQVGYKN